MLGMFDPFWLAVGSKGAVGVGGAFCGVIASWVVGRRRRARERGDVLRGEARETVVIAHHLLERRDGSGDLALRIRSLGQERLDRVVPNGYLASALRERSRQVTGHDALISMDGAEGSYLLETLTNFVCDRVVGAPFEHDLYVMAPCCEPADLAGHQPVTIILISTRDLALFEDWSRCRAMEVEHGSDGGRILTLMGMARRFQQEREELGRARVGGGRTRYLETMYLLDLALDARAAPVPTKPVPWERFAGLLGEMGLEGVGAAIPAGAGARPGSAHAA